jgi:hypothetical protein
MNRSSIVTVLVIVVVFVLCCCLILAVAVAGGAAYGLIQVEQIDGQGEGWSVEWETPAPTPVVIRPTPHPTQQVSGEIEPPAHSKEELPVETDGTNPAEFLVSAETQETLANTIVPISDLRELAQRLEDKAGIPETLPSGPFELGDRKTFWGQNADENINFQIETTLQYVTDHLYFWIEDGVKFDEEALRQLAETFETEIYPTNREFFGSEWTPGVDSDPHLYLLYARNLGQNLAGGYSSFDEYHPLAFEYSNAFEGFVLNADNQELDADFTYGVLAHEFQHMIHWYQDRNEASWLNEGFAELAVFLNGHDLGGFDVLFSRNPDLQLTDWPNDPDLTSPHYGASFLFVAYFLDRFGEAATQALVEHPANDMDSIDLVLSELNIRDSQSGEPLRADDAFIDWAVTNYLLDPAVDDGRFSYHNYPDAPAVDATETLSNCPSEPITRAVSQYGADYVRITCRGETTLHFEGSIQVGVLPANPYSGDYAFWSNRGDESDMTLTQSFDFSDHSGPLTLRYWTWYDLEADYDYIYLEASINGQSWQILQTPSSTLEDPSGNSYGWGYNGLSGGDGHWIQESVDLSEFAGQQVQLRFEYVTDSAVHGEGFLLDDIAIPEIGYFTDFEGDAGGWQAAGFARIQNLMPQTFELALIEIGETTSVRYISLTPDNTADIELTLGGEIEQVVLVVSGSTRYTRQQAAYRYQAMP